MTLSRGRPLARRPMKRTRMKQQQTDRLIESRQQLAENQQIVWARDRGMCVRCADAGVDYHHRHPRGMGGASRNPAIHSPANLICLCRRHHSQAEAERSWAESQGYILRSGADPTQVTVNYWGRLALLTHDGQVVYVDDSPSVMDD